VLGKSEETGRQLHRLARLFSIPCSGWWYWFWLGLSTPAAIFIRLWKQIKTLLHYIPLSPGDDSPLLLSFFFPFVGSVCHTALVTLVSVPYNRLHKWVVQQHFDP